MCFVLALVFGFCLLLVCVYVCVCVCVCVRGGVVIEGVVLQFCVQREPLREGGGRGGGATAVNSSLCHSSHTCHTQVE